MKEINGHLEIETEAEYRDIKAKWEANDSATRAYLRDNKTNCIPSEVIKTFPFESEITNATRSALETWDFIHDVPESYFLYIDEANSKATTWMGQVLGSVYFGDPYISNFGDKRVAVTVFAINGRTYYGTYFKSAGDYARVKIKKER